MDYLKFKSVLKKFAKTDIINLLGKRYDQIIEWESDEYSFQKDALIDILIKSDGFSLFKNKKFRENYYQHVDIDILQELLNTNETDYEKLAKEASKKHFVSNPFYKRYFEILNCPDYEFEDSYQEQTLEVIEQTNHGKNFYELFDYQYLVKQQAIYELERKQTIGRRILIQMPTGTGKTKTAMHVISHYLNFINKNGLVLWVAHNNELLQQAFDTFRDVWSHLGTFPIKVEKSWGKDPIYCLNGVIFYTIQGLQAMKNSDLYSELVFQTDLFIYDECHKIGAKETLSVVKDFIKPKEKKLNFIGLTATPGRSTEYSIGNIHFADFWNRVIKIDINVVNTISMPEMEALNAKKIDNLIEYFQEGGFLSKLEKEELNFTPSQEIVDSLKTQFDNNLEDYTLPLINKIASNKQRNLVILQKLRELNNRKIPTIVFACSVDHAKMLSSYLSLEDIPNSLVYGEMPTSMRKKAIADFKNRDSEVNIIINFDILTTGFDSTNIQCVFITRPTKSVILYSQMIGRGLRGKKMGGNSVSKLIDVKENLDIYNEKDAFKHFDQYFGG